MLWKLVSLLVGSRWRTFCGYSRSDFREQTTAVLDDLGYEYEVDEAEATKSEEVMLGAEEGTTIRVREPAAFEITILSATADPLTRFGLQLFMTEKRREEVTGDLSVVDIGEIDAANESAIATYVTAVIDACDRPPWKLTHHVGFRLAFLLRLKVRLLWRYWQSVEQNETG